MRRSSRRFLEAALDRLRVESGQVIAIVAVCMVVFVGMAGIVIDVGHLYVVQRQLQTATDAAVLAAAQDLPDGADAISRACEYSAGTPGDTCDGTPLVASGKNAISGVSGVDTTVQLKCLSIATAGTKCVVTPGCPAGTALPPSGTFVGGCNAVTVKQTVNVTPWFMSVLGFGSQNVVSATATASMAGGTPHPLDIEVVIDTTASMESACSSGVDGIPVAITPTKLDCAKAGVRALLGSLYPCSILLTDCGAVDSSHNVAGALDKVGLMTFPAVKRSGSNSLPPDVTGVVTQETNCVDDVGGSNVTYTTNPNYFMVPLSSDYRTSDTATVLNKLSPIVQGVWWKNCPGGVYPAGGGGGASSIVGGATDDRSTASNGAGIANGPGAAADRSGASTGSGIAGGPATAANRSGASNYPGISAPGGSDRSGASNGGGIAGGPGSASNRSGANNDSTIGGGPGGSSGDRSSASNSGTSISIARPGNAVAGDLVLVSVTAQGDLPVGASGGICAPNGSWTRIMQTVQGSGATQLTQATFRTTTDMSSPYQFTFRNGTCLGSAVSVSATAVAVRYTGVDAANPIDASAGNGDGPRAGSAPSTNWTSTASTSTTTFNGSAPSTNWTSTGPTLTQTLNGSATASTSYNSTTHYVSGSTNCVSTTNTTCDVAKFAQAGSVTAANFDLNAAVGGFFGTGYTITLLKNHTTSVGTCTIAQGSSAGSANCNIGGLPAAALSTDTFEFQVVKTGGQTSTTSTTVATTITESYTGTGGNNTNYVSLASSSVSQAPGGVVAPNDAIIAATGTLTSASLTFGAAVPSGNSYAVTLLVNGVATTSTCTIAAGGTGCSVSPTGITLTATNRVELRVVHTGSAALVTTATTTLSESVPSAPAGVDTNYVSLSTACVDTAIAPCNVTTIGATGSLSSASLMFGANVPSGNSFTVTLFVNGAASASACTITAGNNSCTIGGGLALTAGDQVELRVFHASGTTALVTTATTALTATTLTAPAVVTTQANDRVVRFYGTGATDLSGDTFTATGSSTATGTEDASQAAIGTTGTATATSSASDNWVGQTVALRTRAGDTSITVTRPGPPYAAGDFLLVSVTAEGLDGGTICRPDNSWTQVVETTQGSGATSVKQTTFRSFRPGAGAETYQFTFHTGNCSSGLTAGNAATAVAVRYTGVDPTNPVDDSAGAIVPLPNPGTTVTAPAATAGYVNEQVVRLFGTGATSISAGSTFTQTGASTATGIADASQAGTGSTGTAAATAPSAGWVGQTVVLKDARSSITVTRPANNAAGDFLLVSVTAEGLDGGTICRPDNSWTEVLQTTQGSGATSITHATFWSVRPGAGAETYVFTFHTGNCSSGLGAGIPATAVAVRYTGVDPANPIDVSGAGQGNTGTTMTAPSVTTTATNDRVVRMYGTGAASISAGATFTQPGSSTATGWEDAVQAAAGPSTTDTATAGSSGQNWVAQTVALRGVIGGSSITVSRPATAAAGDFLLVTVTAEALTGNVCAPNSSWTQILKTTQGSGASSLTQATFWSIRPGAGAETYQFTFHTGNCSSGLAPGIAASALAVRYTGVDSASPIDQSAGATTPGANPGTALTAPAVSAAFASEQVVRLYGTGATSISAGSTFTQAGGSTATGVADALQVTPGSTGTAAATAPNATWVGQTVALKDARSSITVNRPANAAAGDFLLVSVTAEGLAGGTVCAPDTSWTQVLQTLQGAGATSIIQATFRSFRPGNGAETYEFTFHTGGCSSTLSPGIAATAVAVRYTGVDPTTPVDVSGAGSGTGTTLTAPSVTTTVANDRVVRMYGTGAVSVTGGAVTFSQAGTSTATGVGDATQAGAGATGTTTATAGSSADWVAQTIALNTRTSIVIGRPANRSDADLMLVSVTAQNLGSGSICPANAEWTQVQQRQQPASGANTTQATFWSVRGTTDDELYQFDFRTSCLGGNPIVASASAIAVRYTGVNLLFPIDQSADAVGSSTTLTAPAVTAGVVNERIVRFYGTTPSISGVTAQATNGSATATGFEDASQAGTGSTGTATATTNPSHNWVAATIGLQPSGPGCSNNCWYGLQDPGGVSTYYAGAIAAAQAELISQSQRGQQRVIILLSDGDANTLGPNACQAAITNAETAQTPLVSDGSVTWVFTIAYNANATGGCGTDTPSITALCAMHVIAHNYRTDPAVSPSTPQSVCSDNSSEPEHRFYNQPADGDLTEIFQQIGESLSATRLVSNAAA